MLLPYSGFSKIKFALRFILEVNEERGDFVLVQFARVSRFESPGYLKKNEKQNRQRKAT
jgi:hypothetical protein